MVHVGDTEKRSSVWTSRCSKNVSTNSAILLKLVRALLYIKLIIGNCCSNNLPVKTESVQESWQPLHNQQDSNSQHCKQLNSVNKTLCYIILFTMICYVLFNTRLSLFNKISDQSFTHNNAQRQDIAPRSDIQYKHRRYYNKQKLQPGKCLTGQNKIKNKNKNKNDLWFLNKAGRRVGRRQPVAKVYNYIERYYLSLIVYDDRVRL